MRGRGHGFKAIQFTVVRRVNKVDNAVMSEKAEKRTMYIVEVNLLGSTEPAYIASWRDVADPPPVPEEPKGQEI